MPASRKRLVTAKSCSISRRVRLAVGSSRMRTLGSRESALPISSICFCAMPSRRTGDAKIERETEPVEYRPARVLLAATIEQSRNSRRALLPKKHIVDDVEVGRERQLLKDHGDPGGAGRYRIVDGKAVAGAPDRTAIGAVHAGNDFGEGRFARTVLAEQRMDFPAGELETCTLERPRRSERLV